MERDTSPENTSATRNTGTDEKALNQGRSPAVSPLLALVEGTECTWCEDGRLIISSYKNDPAAVCSECGTPGVRVW